MEGDKFYWSFSFANNEILFNNIPALFNNIKEKIKLNPNGTYIPNDENKINKIKYFYEEFYYGELLIISYDTKHLSSRKSFQELIKIVKNVLVNLIDKTNALQQENEDYIAQFIHNLTSLNTYNIQELYSLIPQQTLSENINTQKEVAKNIISLKPNVTSETLLKLIKYNLAMKVEFSVFMKINSNNPSVQKVETDIRSFLLHVIQIFIDDFDKKNIDVQISAYFNRVFFDNDLLFVSTFYILDNAVKYCCPNSKLKIFFKDDENFLHVIFDMISTRIEDDELERIFEKNYRSKMSRQLTTDGEGIGMYRILKTLNLNNIAINIIPNVTEYKKTKNNIDYHHNQIVLKFNKKRIF